MNVFVQELNEHMEVADDHDSEVFGWKSRICKEEAVMVRDNLFR